LHRGATLNAAKFPNLKYLVHTGFYSHSGTYKFKETLVYASKNFNTLSLPRLDTSAPLF